MGRPTVYLETTVVAYLTARPSRDVVSAALQQVTHTWWADRHRLDLFVSQLVVDEAAAGDPSAAARRLAILADLPVLPGSAAVRSLSAALVKAGAVPATAAADAVHVAFAATYGLEYLATWNCKHIANATMRSKIESVCRSEGYVPPVICTPAELVED